MRSASSWMSSKETRRSRCLVADLDRGDLVAVLIEIGPPRLDDRSRVLVSTTPWASRSVVATDLVDDPVVGGAQLEDAVAQIGVGGQRADGSIDKLLASDVGIVGHSRRLRLGVRVDGVDEMADDVWQRTAGDLVQLVALVEVSCEFELREPRCEGRGLVLGDGEGGGLLRAASSG